MKILHCIAQLPMKTGSGVYFSILVEGLQKKGYKNAVLYGTQNPYAKSAFKENLKSCLNNNSFLSEYPVQFLTEALPFPIAGMSDIMPYESSVYSKMTNLQYAMWLNSFEKNLLLAKKEFQPDVIIVHHTFILASLINRIFSNKKIIALCHGTDIRQMRKNKWIKEKYISDLKAVNLFLSVSAENVIDIQEIFSVDKEKIHVIGGGFNPIIFNDKNKHSFDGIFKLVYAGKIAESKGVFELVKALPVIQKKYPNTQLTLIGTASAEQKIQLEKNAENNKGLYIVPAKTQERMSEILKQSDIFILPSYYEALGLIAIEALACGLYAVTTDIEGLMKLLGKKINSSGIIEYVKRPCLYDIDKAVKEDKELFVHNLAEKIMIQIDRIQNKKDIYSSVAVEIKKNSWDVIIEKVERLL